MAAPLTLAEFKIRLADRDARERLGVDLTDQQALQVLVDDQKIAELYVQWRTAEPQPASEPAAKKSKLSFWRDPRAWVIGGVVVVAAIIGGVALANTVMESNRKQEFAQILSDDSTVTDNLRNLEGESLDAVFSSECDKVRDGWTEEDQAQANINNWPGVEGRSEISQAQYIANTMAMFRAAVTVCG